jgi:hypothetical protein
MELIKILITECHLISDVLCVEGNANTNFCVRRSDVKALRYKLCSTDKLVRVIVCNTRGWLEMTEVNNLVLMFCLFPVY